MNISLYKSVTRNPLTVQAGDYPIFSEIDNYVKNYEKISSDHLSEFEAHGVNPFIEEGFWNQCEEITATLVRRFTNMGGRVLDVGCGMGRLLGKLPEYERYGMDISASYLSYATKSGSEVCLAKVEDMPYQDEVFDTVVCTDVLEHVLDLNTAIGQLFRVTKTGGHLIIRVPYRETLEPYLRSNYPYQLAHLRSFDEYSLRILFEKIFNGRMVDEVRGPYLENSGYFKWPVEMRGAGFAVRRLLQLYGLISPKLRGRLVRKIFHPVEISIVIKKL